MASGAGEKRAYLRHGWAHTDSSNSVNLDGDDGGRACAGVCVRASVCMRMGVCMCVCMCMRAYMRACVMCLPYTIILFDPD